MPCNTILDGAGGFSRLMALAVVVVGTATFVGCAAGSAQRKAAPPPPQAATPPEAVSPEQLEQVQQTVSSGLPSLNRRCYGAQLAQREQPFDANAVVRILIGTRGKAERVELGATDIESPEFRQCIVDEIMRWDFPALPEATEVSYPLSFTPSY
jgi:hypothetical protein